MESKKPQKTNSIISLIGLILLLLGIYTSVKTGVNLIFFKKYPTTSVVAINLTGTPPYYTQREEDCQYPMTYFTQTGEPRTATEDEKKYEIKQTEICLSGVQQAREDAKVNDVSSSALLLFLGLGVLIGKRYIV